MTGTRTKHKHIYRNIVISIIAVVLLVLIIGFVMIHTLINQSFSRGDYPDYPVTDYFYDHYAEDYPREEVSFLSGENELKAYLYGEDDAERLLIFLHGLGGAHESYMSEILYISDHGYRVLAIDGTGSGTSEGSGTRGLLQSSLDLDATFTYLASNPEFKDMPVYLMGHSWGGIAVAEASGRHDNVVAIASLSGCADPVALLVEQASQMAGVDLRSLRFMFSLSQRLSFGPENYQRNVLSSLENSDTPILLIHGSEDELIPVDTTAIVAYEDVRNNPHVTTLILTEEGMNGHVNYLHSKEAIPVIKAFNAKFSDYLDQLDKDLSEDERMELVIAKRAELVQQYEQDRDLLNATNEGLLDQILEFFDSHS